MTERSIQKGAVFRALVIAAAILLSVGSLFLVRRLFSGPKTKFIDAYKKLELGFTQNEIEERFGKRPNSTYYFKSLEIWYYEPPEDITTGELPETPMPNTEISSLEELPDVYNFVQLAFDRNKQLFAYTWIGEESQVHSINGNVKGSYLGLLDEDQF